MFVSRFSIGAAVAAAAFVTLVGPGAEATGNGAPSGAHYNLNIIGVDNPKTADMNNTSGHTIFVGLNKADQKIELAPDTVENPGFEVLDRNAFDDPAQFQLPSDVSTTYDVYARALGKPDGTATMKTCYEDSTGTWCNTGEVLTRTTGKNAQQFKNVSSTLLYIDGVALFSDPQASYWWEYTNNGLRLAQLRFYERPAA